MVSSSDPVWQSLAYRQLLPSKLERNRKNAEIVASHQLANLAPYYRAVLKEDSPILILHQNSNFKQESKDIKTQSINNNIPRRRCLLHASGQPPRLGPVVMRVVG
ncbi:hypothetical protein Fuma_04546 [Fuerstiella marisgermanici]|uniref:Uncharacterized protein n=1 Tax=Fuerstiella marisgermanici TaxID=1891926 RepID=A0A1P8WLF5_9PLAN|nr:hypothetical protein Fuma_04546 [Fuerstiella marisgermanici]